MTLECYEKLIKKDMIHPLTNEKLKAKDIIVMQRVCWIWSRYIAKSVANILVYILSQGGTGYSMTNESLEGDEKRPALQV